METREKHDKEIYLALKTNQLKMMEISGIDIKRLQAQQAETAAKMAEIAAKIREGFQETASHVAELHRNTVISHYKLQMHPLPLYICYDPLEKALDCDKSSEVSPANDPSDAKADATCDVAENICRPYLELHGMGPGVPVSGTVTCGLVFSPTQKVDRAGSYKISALTQTSGYQLMQIWGCSCGGSTPPTAGHLKITARLCAKQLFDESWSPEYVLLDTTAGGPPSAVNLNGYITHYTSLRKDLEVDIKVEFKIDASINGCGQIYVDLQTSNFFYVKVPAVTFCRRRYIWRGPFELAQQPLIRPPRHL